MAVVFQFCQWLGSTDGSVALRESVWVYPIVESVHVLALCLFVGFATILDFRLLGVALRRDRVSEVAKRLLPWTMTGFVVMVVTGALLFYSDPVRFYGNVFFRIKVVLLILAGLNAWVFHASVYLRVATWDLDPVPPSGARVAGAASLALWTGIITAGRMIAYNWFN